MKLKKRLIQLGLQSGSFLNGALSAGFSVSLGFACVYVAIHGVAPFMAVLVFLMSLPVHVLPSLTARYIMFGRRFPGSLEEPEPLVFLFLRYYLIGFITAFFCAIVGIAFLKDAILGAALGTVALTLSVGFVGSILLIALISVAMRGVESHFEFKNNVIQEGKFPSIELPVLFYESPVEELKQEEETVEMEVYDSGSDETPSETEEYGFRSDETSSDNQSYVPS